MRFSSGSRIEFANITTKKTREVLVQRGRSQCGTPKCWWWLSFFVVVSSKTVSSKYSINGKPIEDTISTESIISLSLSLYLSFWFIRLVDMWICDDGGVVYVVHARCDICDAGGFSVQGQRIESGRTTLDWCLADNDGNVSAISRQIALVAVLWFR